MSITSSLNMLDLVSLKQLCSLCAVFHTGFWMTFHFTASHFHLLQLWSIWWQSLNSSQTSNTWRWTSSVLETVSVSIIHTHFVNPFHPHTTECLADISLAVEASRLYGQGKQSLLRLIPEQMCVHMCVCVCVCVYISYW